MNFKSLFILLMLVFTSHLNLYGATIKAKFEALLNAKTDRIKDSIANGISIDFADFLKNNDSDSFDFKQLSNVGVVKSPDNEFTIYLYNIIYADGTCRYFGFIQLRGNSGYRVITLMDSRDKIENPNFERVGSDKWFGTLYYQIVPQTVNGKKYYTLLGHTYHNLFISKKVIDVLEIDNGEVYFGSPLFFDGKRKASRIVFEFSARVSMTLKYIPEIKSIVFDHLTSSQPGIRDFQFFGPDGSIDGFTWDKNCWILSQNFDMRLPKQGKKKSFNISNY